MNDTENLFLFNGNVWITITPNDDNIKTIELDVKNLDISPADVSVYRSRILSDLNFQIRNDRDERSAQLIEGDVSIEDDQSDMLMNSTEWVDSNFTNTNVEKESQELPESVEDNVATTDLPTDEVQPTDEIQPTDEVQPTDGNESIEESSDASEPSETEPNDYNTVDTTWNGLFQNDSMLTETNPDDQTELQIDGIQFNAERQKLIITLGSELRKGHYYIVKVFFSGKMTDDYGLVYKSYDGTESSDKFS